MNKNYFWTSMCDLPIKAVEHKASLQKTLKISEENIENSTMGGSSNGYEQLFDNSAPVSARPFR